MFRDILFLYLILSDFSLFSGHNILVSFSQPNKSHTRLGNAFVKRLLEAGHEVTYISLERPNYESPKLRFIDVSSSVNAFLPGKMYDVQRLIENKGTITNMFAVLQANVHVPNATIYHPEVQALLLDTREKFDVVVTEWLYSELYFGLSTVFNCPLIVVSTIEPVSMFLSLLDFPNPAVTPNRLTTRDPPFTFWERIVELYKLVDFYVSSWLMSGIDNVIFEQAFSAAVTKRGRTLPPYSQVRNNISLVLANSHVTTGLAMNLPPNFKQIGGFHIDEEVTPLPDNLQEIMDKAEHGVIYFSLGTVVRVKEMPNDMTTQLLQMFRGLKQTVIWKSDSMYLKSIDNVFVFDFVPQQSILAHPNCQLFITHGGLLSMTEAIHFGVPVVGVPLFSDQFINVERAVQRGFGRKIEADFNMAHNLKIVIKDMLSQSRYKERMTDHSNVYHHRLTSPGAELVYWVSQVVTTRGAPHLQPPVRGAPGLQMLYLDLVMVVIVVAILINMTASLIRRYIMIKFSVNTGDKFD